MKKCSGCGKDVVRGEGVVRVRKFCEECRNGKPEVLKNKNSAYSSQKYRWLKDCLTKFEEKYYYFTGNQKKKWELLRARKPLEKILEELDVESETIKEFCENKQFNFKYDV